MANTINVTLTGKWQDLLDLVGKTPGSISTARIQNQTGGILFIYVSDFEVTPIDLLNTLDNKGFIIKSGDTFDVNVSGQYIYAKARGLIFFEDF